MHVFVWEEIPPKRPSLKLGSMYFACFCVRACMCACVCFCVCVSVRMGEHPSWKVVGIHVVCVCVCMYLHIK